MSTANEDNLKGRWALILGASSGFGGSTATHLASLGMNILGIHLDRKATMPMVEDIKKKITDAGQEAVFINMNAADEKLRTDALDSFQEKLGDNSKGSMAVLVHSLAFGTLKPFFMEDNSPGINKKNMEMTLDVMAHSLVYWTQDCIERNLLSDGSSIFAMTSSGGEKMLPNYGAVSAAKAALESHIRQLAFELGPRGIRANSMRAGVTDTPALRKIPGADLLLEKATGLNPFGRLTTPNDVALAIGSIAGSGGYFISGNVIGVDGAEHVVG